MADNRASHMKRISTCIALAALFIPPPALAADWSLFQFACIDYRVEPAGGAAPEPGTYLQVGDGFEAVGRITSFGPLLDPWTDASIEAYTVHLSGFRVGTRRFDGGVLWCQFEAGARITVYADSAENGVAAVFDPYPPNAAVPSTFTDGDGSGWLQLAGTLDWVELTYDFNRQRGSMRGCVTLSEGYYLVFIPPAQRSDWSFFVDLDATGALPGGFDQSMVGIVEEVLHGCGSPTGASIATWGAVKAMYR
jgi:hypothetical protein